MSESPEKLRKRARAAYKARLYSEAAAYYDALRELPDIAFSAEELVEHALAYMKSAQPRQAEAALRSAILLAPDDGAIHARLGHLILRTGRTHAALDCFRTAARLSRDAGSYWQLFQIEQSLGNQSEAEQALAACLAADPDHPEAREITTIQHDPNPGGPKGGAGPEAADSAFVDLVQFIQHRSGEDARRPTRRVSLKRYPVLVAAAAASAFMLLFAWGRSMLP